ncbi:hypothetical protein [Massilia genomosp. 1]|uniref:Uncharacterized protein n=1 Tax=Massilia genomosp. 1 TaxID=2609280 RepID=A0ABX0MVK9_9BURK|nr:hypothetical protein [Massilia genomosp. 1]NHZ66521.1 hypothetical protein [Massilia genomosp. 1]
MARERNLAIFRFTNAAAVATGAGRIAGNAQESVVGSNIVRAALFGTASRTDKTQGPICQSAYAIAAQNLYEPVAITSITYAN